MRTKLLHIIRTKPFYLYLLPVFFVLHGYTENYSFIPAINAVKLTGIFIGISLFLTFIFWLFYRNFTKASLMAFIAMAYNFFFGSIQDLLKNILLGTNIYRYAYILPLSLLCLTGLFIVIKKRKTSLFRVTLFLNALLILLIVIDTGILFNKIILKPDTSQLISNNFLTCDSCSKPDIYLIIADEYAGNTELRDLLKFDNSKFETSLKNRGFHFIKNSFSNYNFTPFSIASMLDMNYLKNLVGSNTSSHDQNICYSTIKENKTFQFFQKLGYKIYNCSIFDLTGDPKVTESTFLPGKTKPIIAQTFIYRINRDLGYYLATDLHLKFVVNNIIYQELKNNKKVNELTKIIAKRPETQPKFVYTHLVMPHPPYYFDSAGNPTPLIKMNLPNRYNKNKNDYLNYLVYTNKYLLQLVDHIKGVSTTPPIIILMSDHGFRSFENNDHPKYNFLNLNSVFIPGSDYSNFYDNMSNINQFRVILNSQFGQHLPLLKDSTIFIRE